MTYEFTPPDDQQHDVPMDVHRENELLGDLDLLLKPEQVRQINEQYTIDIHLGGHGVNMFLGRATQADRDQATAVVNGMQQEDTLFLERLGFIEQPTGSQSSLERAAYIMGKNERLIAQRKAMVAKYGLPDSTRSESAWETARKEARGMGIRVLFADIDAVQRANAVAAAGGKSERDLLTSPDEGDRKLFEEVYMRGRERAAASVMISWVLDHPIETPAPDGHKPRLVLLFGAAHEEGFRALFGALGLDAQFNVMDSSTREERLAEEIDYIRRNPQDGRAFSELQAAVGERLGPTEGSRFSASSSFGARYSRARTAMRARPDTQAPQPPTSSTDVTE